MNKRILVTILTIIITAGLMIGCGGNYTSKSLVSGTEETTEITAKTEEDSTEEFTEVNNSEVLSKEALAVQTMTFDDPDNIFGGILFCLAEKKGLGDIHLKVGGYIQNASNEEMTYQDAFEVDLKKSKSDNDNIYYKSDDGIEFEAGADWGYYIKDGRVNKTVDCTGIYPKKDVPEVTHGTFKAWCKDNCNVGKAVIVNGIYASEFEEAEDGSQCLVACLYDEIVDPSTSFAIFLSHNNDLNIMAKEEIGGAILRYQGIVNGIATFDEIRFTPESTITYIDMTKDNYKDAVGIQESSTEEAVESDDATFEEFDEVSDEAREILDKYSDYLYEDIWHEYRASTDYFEIPTPEEYNAYHGYAEGDVGWVDPAEYAEAFEE